MQLISALIKTNLIPSVIRWFLHQAEILCVTVIEVRLLRKMLICEQKMWNFYFYLVAQISFQWTPSCFSLGIMTLAARFSETSV
jgi:hypothetical protein